MEEIDPRHLLVTIAKILKKLKIPYIITGGIAVLVWGRPRFTADIDIVIELPEEKVKGIKEALLALGKAGYIDEISVKLAISREGEFNFIDGVTGVKVDFWIFKKSDPFDASRFKRRRVRTILDEKIYFTSPEDLILIKLKWYLESKSSKQLEDIESIFKISSKILDKRYLASWAKRIGGFAVIKKFL